MSLFGVAAVNPNCHPSVLPPPEDTVSSLQWHPSGNYLLATSWDAKIRLWEIHEAQATSSPQFMDTLTDPLLCCCWSSDGNNIFYGGTDCNVNAHSFSSSVKAIIGKHEKPVSWIKWIKPHNLVMSGSWDKTLKLWDGRQPLPVYTAQLPERLYCGDVNEEVGVFATAERHILIMEFLNGVNVYKQIHSPLKFQSRCCRLFNNKKGFALGSIDGRVAVYNIFDESSNFSFQCHRDKANNIIYPVNDIAFHPINGIMATCGSDGGFTWWNKDERKLVHEFKNLSLPITHCSWNSTGSIFSYAAGYDWTKGTRYKTDNPTLQTHIFLTNGTIDDKK